MTTNYDALIPTPFGALAISSHHMEISVELLSSIPENLPDHLHCDNEIVKQIQTALMHYLDQASYEFNLNIKVQGTPFQQRVWQAISAIPVGETITYGELAKRVSSSPRAVANACGANPLPVIVPCHRVVAKSSLGGFNRSRSTESLAIKQWLLSHECAK